MTHFSFLSKGIEMSTLPEQPCCTTLGGIIHIEEVSHEITINMAAGVGQCGGSLAYLFPRTVLRCLSYIVNIKGLYKLYK